MRELLGGDRRAQGLKAAFGMTETLDSDMSAAYNSSNGPADRIPHERQKRRGHTNGGSERPGSSKFTQSFLASLGYASSSDRLIINVLKAIGFLTPSGEPTERYIRYLDPAQSAGVLTEGIREAYADLFQVNTAANTMTRAELKGKLKVLAGEKSRTPSLTRCLPPSWRFVRRRTGQRYRLHLHRLPPAMRMTLASGVRMMTEQGQMAPPGSAWVVLSTTFRFSFPNRAIKRSTTLCSRVSRLT